MKILHSRTCRWKKRLRINPMGIHRAEVIEMSYESSQKLKRSTVRHPQNTTNCLFLRKDGELCIE